MYAFTASNGRYLPQIVDPDGFLELADAIDHGFEAVFTEFSTLISSEIFRHRIKLVAGNHASKVGKQLRILTGFVMQTRSFRGSGEPAWVNASSNAC
jgi:hypothetical protein